MEADILIRNGWVVTMDAERRIREGADVAISGSRILAIGADLDVQAQRIIDARNKAVLPGFVDAHMHETLPRGLAEDLPLDRWLSEICFPIDRSYTEEIMRAAALMSQYEMIRNGITTFLDIYRFPAAAANVAEISGLRAIFTPQIMIDPPLVGETIESAEAFVSTWQERCTRITPGFGPHAPYSCPPDAYRRLVELAERYNAPLHTHLAETKWEVGELLNRYGCSPVDYLDRAGALSPRLSVAHGVQLTPWEIRHLVEKGVSVVYNPTSNMKLASGVAPVPAMLAAGMNVGLGTDSNLSNNNLDMFEEMRTGSFLQKLHNNNATILPCEKMLEMATLGSARALGMDETIGSLEPGKQADVILVDLAQPHLLPLVRGKYLNLVEQLVYSAGAADVTHTIVAGKVLMADSQILTLDKTVVCREVDKAIHDLLKRAGME